MIYRGLAAIETPDSPRLTVIMNAPLDGSQLWWVPPSRILTLQFADTGGRRIHLRFEVPERFVQPGLVCSNDLVITTGLFWL